MKNQRILLILVTMLVASACVKINLDIDVNEDGSAQFNGIVAVDADQVADLAESLGEDGLGEGLGNREQICNDFLSENDLESDAAAPGLEAKPYDEGGLCGVEFTGTLSPDEVEQQMGDLSGGGDGTLRREGDGWFFELPLGGDALGTDSLADGGAFFDLDEVFGGAEYIVRVKLPGRQIEHNADAIESDGTMVWNIDFLNPPERLFVRTEAGETITGNGGDGGGGDGGGGSLKTVLIVLVALALLGIVAYLVLRQKKRPIDLDAALSTPAPPAPGQGAEPPGPGAQFPGQDFAQPPVAPGPIFDDSTPMASGAGEGPADAGDAFASGSGAPLSESPVETPFTGGQAPAPQTSPAAAPQATGEWTPPPAGSQSGWSEPDPTPAPETTTEWATSELVAEPAPEATTQWSGPEPTAPAPEPTTQWSAPEPTAQSAPEPVAEPAPETITQAETPQMVASPTPDQATGGPVWDSDRNQYVQWDPTAQHWLDFDDATQAWRPRT